MQIPESVLPWPKALPVWVYCCSRIWLTHYFVHNVTKNHHISILRFLSYFKRHVFFFVVVLGRMSCIMCDLYLAFQAYSIFGSSSLILSWVQEPFWPGQIYIWVTGALFTPSGGVQLSDLLCPSCGKLIKKTKKNNTSASGWPQVSAEIHHMNKKWS